MKRNNVILVYRALVWSIQVAALLILIALTGVLRVQAQDTVPPTGAWSEVVNADGSINYNNLTDNGVVTQQADWMPSVFGQSIEAEYHSYTTPTGNQILMPTATTLFFMSMNPSESGYLAAASTLGSNGGTVSADAPIGIASPGGMFASLFGNAGGENMMNLSNQAGQTGPTSPESFFAALASGQQSIWSVNPGGLTNFLGSLLGQTGNDFLAGNGANLYTYMLLYTPGSCGQSPIGCSPEQIALLNSLTLPPTNPSLPTPPPPPGVPNCPPPQVIPGEISYSAEKIAPNYPLVVGQDPDRRGVDVRFEASVAPTIYITYEAVPEYNCVDSPGAPGGNGCSEDEESIFVGWFCQEIQQTFEECIAYASGSASLSAASREWILNGELSIRYPGAYLHNPDFGFGGGNGACSWSDVVENVQVEDPGTWDLSVDGRTSGTPVSAPRGFGGGAGEFDAWLIETTIIK
jgi:hypothetical protein